MSDKYIKKRLLSFKYAVKGIYTLISTQPNAVIHLVVTVLVILSGIYFKLDRYEWIGIASALAAVWITEAINTSIEFLVNLVSPEYNPLAGKVKDLAAAAVLIATIYAVVVGTFIFLPKIF